MFPLLLESKPTVACDHSKQRAIHLNLILYDYICDLFLLGYFNTLLALFFSFMSYLILFHLLILLFIYTVA